MAYSSIWQFTDLPEKVVDILCEDIKEFNQFFQESQLIDNDPNNQVIKSHSPNYENNKIRSSKNTWIKSNHWIHGFIWHYVSLANRSNFLYDIDSMDSEQIQYSEYREDDFYTWHVDYSIDLSYQPQYQRDSGNNLLLNDKVVVMGESTRKLSFVLQLSDENDYEGGEFQIMNGSGDLYTMPKKRGTMVTFDSRMSHRVRKIKSGVRRSLVGWAVGPRWR